MRALLINPFVIIPRYEVPYYSEEPLALEYLAAVVMEEHEVHILDCVGQFWYEYKSLPDGMVHAGASLEQIKTSIVNWPPDIVGITMSLTNQMNAAYSIARLVKEINTRIVTVAGGLAASAEPDRVLVNCPFIDIVVAGEGELTFKELLDREATGLDRIRGIYYRDKDRVIKNESRELIADLDGLPFPQRDLIRFNEYSGSLLTGALRQRIKLLFVWLRFNRDLGRLREKLRGVVKSRSLFQFRAFSPARYASILTSRGCPFNCYFCSVHSVSGHQYRMRSPGNVLAEIEMLTSNYGVKTINIFDDNFSLSKQRVIEICEGIIERGLRLTLEATTGLYLAPWIDLETLSLMKRAGFNQVNFGIESGNQIILDTVINKRIDLNRVPEVVKICRKAGIASGGFFMIGVPGETKETMEDTIRFAIDSGLEQIRIFTCQAFPGSKLYEDCVKNGWLVSDLEQDRQIPYSSCSNIKTKDFSPQDIYDIAQEGKKKLRKLKRLAMPIE